MFKLRMESGKRRAGIPPVEKFSGSMIISNIEANFSRVWLLKNALEGPLNDQGSDLGKQVGPHGHEASRPCSGGRDAWCTSG